MRRSTFRTLRALRHGKVRTQRARSYSTRMRPIRGMHDLHGEEQRKHQAIISVAKQVATQFGFEEISTPVIELEAVFSRTLGELSDVVSKEMYTFEDKSGNRLAMRPENTAGVVRAFITNTELRQKLPQKLFYSGPMFRYERPQQGRQRQFHQFGVEDLGSASPLADVRIIEMAHLLLQRLDLDNHVTLELNTIGDQKSRAQYRDVLTKYFSDNLSTLSPISQERLQRGSALRILDSKEMSDQELIQAAPPMMDHMTDDSKRRLDVVTTYLNHLGIRWKLNPRLVRGLDYYNDTCFEFVNQNGSAVVAGGRYDSLVEQMGGPSTPGIGWAAGIERLALMLDSSFASLNAPFVTVIHVCDSEDPLHPIKLAASQMAHRLRSNGLRVWESFEPTVTKQLKRAPENISYGVFIGEEELKNGEVVVKDWSSREQRKVKLSEVCHVVKHEK